MRLLRLLGFYPGEGVGSLSKVPEDGLVSLLIRQDFSLNVFKIAQTKRRWIEAIYASYLPLRRQPFGAHGGASRSFSAVPSNTTVRRLQPINLLRHPVPVHPRLVHLRHPSILGAVHHPLSDFHAVPVGRNLRCLGQQRFLEGVHVRQCTAVVLGVSSFLPKFFHLGFGWRDNSIAQVFHQRLFRLPTHEKNWAARKKARSKSWSFT